MKFLWTTILVSNMEKSLDFYRNAVKLKLDRRFSPAPHMDIAFLGEGETKVELICDGSLDQINHSAMMAMGFETDSLDLKMDEMKSLGIPIDEGPYRPSPNIRFFYVLDPDGVRIQFVEEK